MNSLVYYSDMRYNLKTLSFYLLWKELWYFTLNWKTEKRCTVYHLLIVQMKCICVLKTIIVLILKIFLECSDKNLLYKKTTVLLVHKWGYILLGERIVVHETLNVFDSCSHACCYSWFSSGIMILCKRRRKR